MAEQESYGLCDECKAKEACYTVSVMMGDQVTQRRRCPDCMAKMNMNFSAGNVAKMISAIMGALTGQGEEKAPAAPQNEDDAENTVQCESCGTTLQQFVKGGKLGARCATRPSGRSSSPCCSSSTGGWNTPDASPPRMRLPSSAAPHTSG